MRQHNGCKDIYENCKHYQVSKCSTRFLMFTLCFIVIIVVGFAFMRNDFQQSQQKIIDVHNEHLARTEAYFMNIYDNHQNESINYDSLIYALEYDKTLVKKITDYNSVKNIIIDLANNMSYKAMVDELKKDSLFINRQLADSRHTTNELLELHFNRIQHEYTVLALWAGILMIVFLIFSFYSLYKTDDIAKQGKETLKEIAEKGENILSELENQQEELRSQITKETQDFHNNTNTFVETFKSKIATLELTATRLEELFQIMEDTQVEKDNNVIKKNEKE